MYVHYNASKPSDPKKTELGHLIRALVFSLTLAISHILILHPAFLLDKKELQTQSLQQWNRRG